MEPVAPIQYIVSVGTDAAGGLAVFPALQRGDRIKSLLVHVTEDTNALPNVSQLVLSLYALRSVPADATAAALGRKLIGSVSMPMIPGLSDPTGGAVRVRNHLTVRIPLLVKVDQQTRFIAAVCTNGGGTESVGFLALEVERDEVK